MCPFGRASATVTITGCIDQHQTFSTLLPGSVFTFSHPYFPRGVTNDVWLKQEIKKVDKERLKYPRRADLKLRAMELQRALKAAKGK